MPYLGALAERPQKLRNLAEKLEEKAKEEKKRREKEKYWSKIKRKRKTNIDISWI